ncbi:HNH endonuclease signature motif containing protein [Kineococcus xinjiangensis]|uniref:HNH endonuclease signature motif containing protein n=1 Tax=Kineococcus xinjiangensis TaxID=512762 RepID=UPI0011B03D12|nr:HNH endonuclease signature motif containing protein [Kineococcus xinjiangensis]
MRGLDVVGAAAVAGACASLLAGCSGEPEPLPGVQPPATPEVRVLEIPAPTRTVVEEPVVARPAAADGTVLPDLALTPGAVFPDVTREDVCADRYTAGVHNLRYSDKADALVAYGVALRDREGYTIDHLVPVSLGGTNAPGNLWPQPRDGQFAAAHKDQLERQLHALVCAGSVPLAEAQQALVADWRAAVDRYSSAAPPPGAGAGIPAPPPPPGGVDVGLPCPAIGVLAKAGEGGPKLVCTESPSKELTWQKRY